MNLLPVPVLAEPPVNARLSGTMNNPRRSAREHKVRPFDSGQKGLSRRATQLPHWSGSIGQHLETMTAEWCNHRDLQPIACGSVLPTIRAIDL